METLSTPSFPVTNYVSGKIIDKKTGSGIPDLLVVLFDLDAWADPEIPKLTAASGGAAAADPVAALEKGDVSLIYTAADRIGSAVTDDSGKFLFDIYNRDMNVPGKTEQKPDLLLLVFGPDEPGLDLNQRLLHFARDIRYNAGTREGYIIRLPPDLLEKRQIPAGPSSQQTAVTAQTRIQQYIDRHEQDTTFSAGVAQYHGAQANQQVAARKVFRAEFLKTIAANLAATPPPGVVAAEGDNIQEKNAVTINTGIARANAALDPAASSGVPVNLYLTPADRTRLQSYFTGATGTVEIPDSAIGDLLFRANSSENPGTLLIHNNPFAAACVPPGDDVVCAQAHTGIATDSPATPAPPALPPGDTPVTNADVSTLVGRLVYNMPSPDGVLNIGPNGKRADRSQVEKAVSDFSMTTGPAEDPAFYDFNVLQIAFDHVWKQLFDETIPNLAYTANAIGQDRYGVTDIVSNAVRNGNLTISLGYTVAPVELPPVVARFFDITTEEFNELSFNLRDQLVILANTIASLSPGTFDNLRIIQDLTEQGDKLIDCVRQDDYYSLHKTLRDLNARLSGTYEFTVFAADKDYHSVNFGLLTTYRQIWEPRAYQAGRLVKTIPLTPKEERRYSIKTVVNKKRTRKEAEKNNRSISIEQQSTSRVEADIAAKAQNKTTFSLTAEGDYDIGISDGKATTSFGVEALSESAQNRKDFRESVLKAVQDYKQETSMEVMTETDVTAEANESGTLVNPNDELSVTYLFYELQKRYRISEQIYRVLPVVLVAQEVPSPDQITPAWVISNDWILNRCLLDDSFRPTLSYIANNSVGDDFAIRELRKNLRQQRNLVETLRIQFSAASVEADNRYKALETAIATRIDADHQSNSQGLGDDLVNFFGGGGPDPQTAKARELAAKDAQQYALEKAEKAAAALREEVGNLHALTDAFNKAMQARLDNETRLERFLVHIRSNIFYYMQAIWSMEPPDQRFLRLYKVQVPVLELANRAYTVNVAADPDIFAPFREPGTEKHRAWIHGALKHNPDGSFPTVPLVEIADLHTFLGYEGNYMVFPLNQHNALTEFMAAPYVDSAFGAMDPEELANVNLDQYSRFICCLHDKLPEADFDAMKPQLKAWLEQLLASPLRNGDEIVVPTGSLFIEALVDENSLLENFKECHRELDVFKAVEDSRKASLENIRLAARLVNAERGDPEIDKKILIEGGANFVVPAGDQ